MTTLTSEDLVVLVQQAQHAGEYFVEMAAESDELGEYTFKLSEVGEMLDSQPLFLADDRTEIDYRKVPQIVRDAMKYVCWKAAHETLTKNKTGGHAPEGYPLGGKRRRRAAGGSGARLIAAASAYRDALKG
jgi:hypothetical protein